MERVGFKMKLKPGHEAEYKKRHDEIWPELVEELRAVGIRDYTIYHDPETAILFAMQKRTPDHTVASLNEKEIMKRWFAHMGDIMDTNPDGSPVMKPLTETFHMD
ncbi:MAG: L-rhamnose mutarotase [Acidobacteriota bacterium]|jgi:L-rhamnose mutarotase|nr:L-rhamnose mutarotase [Acidobacteriota bacterium]